MFLCCCFCCCCCCFLMQYDGLFLVFIFMVFFASWHSDSLFISVWGAIFHWPGLADNTFLEGQGFGRISACGPAVCQIIEQYAWRQDTPTFYFYLKKSYISTYINFDPELAPFPSAVCVPGARTTDRILFSVGGAEPIVPTSEDRS